MGLIFRSDGIVLDEETKERARQFAMSQVLAHHADELKREIEIMTHTLYLRELEALKAPPFWRPETEK